RYSSKVAGARSPEGEYAQKTLEKLGLLWRLAGCQTPIATGAHPGGEAQASPATSTAFSRPASPCFAGRQPGTVCAAVGLGSPSGAPPAWARATGPCPRCWQAARLGRGCAWAFA